MNASREPTTETGSFDGRTIAGIAGSYLLSILWLFGSGVSGRLPYFRDLSSQYAPDYEFLYRSLREGVWPLWNPLVDGGGPCLFAYPVELLLVGLGGRSGGLALGPPLHLLLAMLGCAQLARILGARPAGAWLAGAVYGLAGFPLSCGNLLQLLHGLAWAPWVLLAFRRLVEAPSTRRAAILALVGAVQLSTLAGEIALQTAIAGLFLVPRAAWSDVGRRLTHVAGAGLLALFAAAPALCGLLTLLAGSARAAGFPAEHALAYSASPLVLAEAVLPRLFGDVHAFSDRGFWGQPLYPQGYPYILSLYAGPVVLLIALRAGWSRLWALAVLGVLLAMGVYGPFARLLPAPLAPFRFPVKFFFLASLAIALLASRGLDRAAEGPVARRQAPWLLVPGLAILALAGIVAFDAGVVGRALTGRLPADAVTRAVEVARATWPSAWLSTGLVTLAAGALLLRGGRAAVLAGLLAVLDLLTVNIGLNPVTERAFYALRPEVKALVDAASREGTYRWFSYGAADTPGLEWRPAEVGRRSDVWLYYLDRQSLLPRTHGLEGLEGAFDADRTGWAPEGSTLPESERRPDLFARHRRRLVQANVRWVLSFRELAPELATLRGTAALPEVVEPLHLYELGDALPRAFWVPAARELPGREAILAELERPDLDLRSSVLLEEKVGRACPREGPGPAVTYLPIDAHTVRLRLSGPTPACGYLVVTNFHHPFWAARGPEGGLPLVRANGRHWAIPVMAPVSEVTLVYSPPWRVPALGASLLGVVIAVTLARTRPGSKLDRIRTNALASVD